MPDRFSALQSWMAQQPPSTISPALEVVDDPIYGRHVRATEKIGPYQTILVLPRPYMVNFGTVLEHLAHSNTQVAQFVKDNGLISARHEPDDGAKFYADVQLDQILSLTSLQLLGWYLAIEKTRSNSYWKPFIDVLPTLEELETVPMSWDATYVDLLPPTTKDRVEKQQIQFDKDFEAVSFAKLSRDQYLWGWLVCNTRCIYIELPQFLRKTPKDNLTLVPYVDFLNHTSDEMCTIKVNGRQFTVNTAKSSYKPGDQVFFQYGPHDDRTLLCEYGFMLPSGQNTWNSVDISRLVMKLLSPTKRQFLQSKDYLDDYTITRDDISFRTEVALAVVQEKGITPRLIQFVDGYTDGTFYRKSTDKLVAKIKQKLTGHYEKKLEELSNSIPPGTKRDLIEACYRNILLITQ